MLRVAEQDSADRAAVIVEHEPAVAQRLGVRLDELARAIDRADREQLEGEAQDVGWGSQIRSYVLHPYTMVKDHRTGVEAGNAQGVLDGDLDQFVRAELLRRAGDRTAA